MASITIIGGERLAAELEQLKNLVTTAESRKAFREGARLIAIEQRRRAPVGRKSDNDENPGLLRRSIVWFLGRQNKREVRSYARVNILQGRNRAPHGHLVSFGTRVRTWNGKFMRFKHKRKWKASRSVGPMPKNSYFEQGLNAAAPAALNHIVQQLKRKAEGK